MVRTRHDIATVTLGNVADAETQDWHPVLATYAQGVELMRALPAEDPESWQWAANTHGLPEGAPSRPAWGQCAHASLFFLPWHRAYLAWFEGTIRKLTGNDGWGLPYWDYSDPDDPDAVFLPAEFRVPTRAVDGETVPNALFDPTRNQGPLPAADIEIVPALAERRFVGGVPDVGFGGTDRDRRFGDVESTPHNWVHVDIGGLMESPATAGQDPIFWLHHANIDRLWEVWLSLPGSLRLTDPGGGSAFLVTQWRSAIFWFGLEQSPSTYTMADVEDLAGVKMGYEYESIQLPQASAEAVAAARRTAPVGGGGFPLDEAEPRWEAVAASFDLDSGEERDVTFMPRPAAWTTHRRAAWSWSSPGCARSRRTRRTSSRYAPRRTRSPIEPGGSRHSVWPGPRRRRSATTWSTPRRSCPTCSRRDGPATAVGEARARGGPSRRG